MTRLEQKRSMFALGAKRASLTLRKSCGSNGSRDSPVSISGGAQNPFERHRFFAVGSGNSGTRIPEILARSAGSGKTSSKFK
jgi:hypothetical protein